MRPYPRNSPRAAARIVVLTMLADGRVQRAELALLEAPPIDRLLGLRRDEVRTVLNDFCADLLEDAEDAGDDDCDISPALIELLLADLDEPTLQRRVLRLCLEVIRADGRLDEGESLMLATAIAQWGFVPEGFNPPVPTPKASSGASPGRAA